MIGINAAIASESGGGLQAPGGSQQAGNIGIGFAIPADEASRIAGLLIATGHATHAVIGVTVNAAASTLGGVSVQTVTAGGPAAAAGLQIGDVVTKIDNQPVRTADGLIAAIRSLAPGQRISLAYDRNGAATTVTIVLGGLPS